MNQKDPLEQAAWEWIKEENNWDTAASCENISNFASLVAQFHRHMIGRPPIDIERIISVMMVWQRDMIGRPDLEDEERMATLRARLMQAMDPWRDVEEEFPEEGLEVLMMCVDENGGDENALVYTLGYYKEGIYYPHKDVTPRKWMHIPRNNIVGSVV